MTAGLDPDQLYDLDVKLGIVGEEPDERLADDVPTTTQDPAAMAALAQFGESVYA